jgi:Tol biopolymer transport system component/DNA-binding winged helix-turn-helix (wHTH) protein
MATQPQSAARLSFGPFEVDAQAGELRRNGIRVRLSGQPFQILLILLAHPGEVVTREQLREEIWAETTFVDFEHGLNAAMNKVRRALGDAAEKPLYIETLPRKGYRFIAPIAGLATAVLRVDSVQISSARRPRSLWILGFSAVVAIAAAAGWIIGFRNAPGTIAWTPVPLTTYAGREMQASFSPDGNQIAFVWNGEKEDNFDLYVKLIGSDTLLRLTSNPAPDFGPAWSPDGRSIAFLRKLGPSRAGVFLIPAIGGPERKLAEIDCYDLSMDASLAWSPDGKWLATTDRSSIGERRGVFLVSAEDGEKRRLTSSQFGRYEDRTPAFSPDGQKLAFVRRRNEGMTDLFVLPLSRDGYSNREPIQVTSGHRWIGAPAWTPDGSEIIFSSGPTEGRGWLWRLRFPGGGTPELLSSLGEASSEPAISTRQARFVYTHATWRTTTWRVDLHSKGANGTPLATRLLSSTRADYNAQYSPDGRRIAFHSMRSGWSEIWVSDSDGSNARQLTFLRAPMTGSPRWAPDGNRIVFDSNAEGQFELYTIRAEGGKPRRLTTNPATDGVGSWSHDGKWIYFMSTRSGERQVWKMPAEGGAAIQLTRHVGYVAFESPDHRFVYYSKGRQETSLWRVPVDGGEEQQLLDSVLWLNFVVAPDGIFFVPGHADGTWSIRFFNFQTGATTVVAPIEGQAAVGLSLSPDGRYILYSENDQQSSELMLVENFR